jgi:hypothetical protein
MCLGIPGEVVETYREHDALMGKVDFGGVAKRVCLDHVPASLRDALIRPRYGPTSGHGRSASPGSLLFLYCLERARVDIFPGGRVTCRFCAAGIAPCAARRAWRDGPIG